MKIVERLFDIMDEKKLKSSDLAKKLDVQNSVISTWRTRQTDPPSKFIIPICEFLNIDVLYLLTGEHSQNNVSILENDHFISIYNSLTLNEKKLVQNCTSAFIDFKNNSSYTLPLEPQLPEVREINYYYKLASAGSGQIIFDTPPSEMIEIPNTYEYRKVNYAIGVNGDSMEPKFYDGDIVLVEITNDIHDGQIGIFDVDGECYIKQLRGSKLISFNKKYNDIPLTEYSRCIGKVIDVLS